MPIPEQLQIHQLDLEIHGACNYKCDMCPQAWGREQAFLKPMSFDLFKKIVDDAMQYGLQSVSLHGSGEPTLNQRMPDMVRYAKGLGVQVVSFTNGFMLNHTVGDALLEAGLDLLRISAIGCNAAAYAKWMRPKSFQTIRDNVQRFVKRRNELGAKTQVHLYHLVTAIDKRDEEVLQYQQNWTEYTGAHSEIWLMHNWSGSYEEEIPYHRDTMALTKKQRSCGRPFSPLLEVRAGGLDSHLGAVVACCMVLGQDSKAVLGHMDHQTIIEVVSAEAYQKLRAAHAQGRFDEVAYCANCDQLYDLPESLVWTNIPGRQYGQSKITKGLDHRSFVPAPRQNNSSLPVGSK